MSWRDNNNRARVRFFDWSPDGTRVVSSDESGEVKVWDAATGEVALSFRAPAAVYSVN